VAYRADIEIAVRGAQELKRLQNEVSATSKLVNQLNNYLENIGDGGVVRSINNLRSVVADAGAAFSKAALGTEEATTAATKYVRATSALNDGLRERAALLKNIADQERRARLAGSGIRETTQYAGPIGPGPASPVGSLVGQKSPVEERIRRTIRARQEEKDLQEALLQLEQRSARLANEELQARGAIAAATAKGVNAAKFAAGQTTSGLMLPAFQERGLQILNNNVKLNESNLRIEQALNGERARGVRFLEKQSAEEQRQIELGILGRRTNRLPGQGMGAAGAFPVSGPIPLSQYGSLGRGTAASALGQTLRGRASGAVGNALIGGAFPLLFGQGGGAAIGGAIGGLAGGAFGGVGGFAGSLVGTLLGDIASRGQAVKQLADDIGFSAEQTKQLSAAFKVANTDVEKFTAVIQNIRGVGLEIEDQAKAIQLVTRLTELYGGSFEKTGNAITSALESGKVTQATLNQLTSQGINVQQALADKYKVSRDTILEMAKDGDISVQTLIDTLVELGNNSEQAATKQQNVFQRAYDQITQAAVQAAQTATGSFTSTGSELQQVAARIQAAFTAMFNELIRGTTEFILGLGEIARIAGSALDGVAAKFIEIQYGIIGAAQNLPALDSGIIQFAKNALAVLNPVGFLIDKIRGAGRNRPQQFGPPVPERLTRLPLTGFRAPSQFSSGGTSGAKGPKPPEDRTADLLDDLNAMKLISTTQDGIRDALFEGNKELAIRLEYDQKVYDINRDTNKALRDANYESEKAAIRAQQIVRLKDAQLVRDDELRELARDISEIITNTLDDLRGGVQWDDTGLRDIFDMSLPDAVKNINENINELIDPANRIIGAATAIGDAFADSFSGIASGAVTAREGLSNFFKSVGQYFIDMAATIAGEALKLQAISILQGLFSKFLNPFSVGAMSLPGLEGTGALSSGPIFQGGAFAEGGFVTGPTRALIGEGGEPEYVIPASKMRGAMSRYSAGARGSGVIPSGSGDGATMGATMTAAPIDVRYTVERINSVDYVTADQFQAGMAQAAQQGAAQGETRALRKLQMSNSTRRRVGI